MSLPGLIADCITDRIRGVSGVPSYCLCSGERQKLYKHWSEELRQGWLDELKLAMRAFERVRDEQRRIHADVDLNVLRCARLVGMTTAGVASKQELVAAMCPKVYPDALHLLRLQPLTSHMPALVCHALASVAAVAMPHPRTVCQASLIFGQFWNVAEVFLVEVRGPNSIHLVNHTTGLVITGFPSRCCCGGSRARKPLGPPETCRVTGPAAVSPRTCTQRLCLQYSRNVSVQ